MGKLWITLIVLVGIIASILWYGWDTYNELVKLNEQVNQGWAQVENVYQRRHDLIPNLVETVKGYAQHESETFKAVTEARALATKVMAPGLIDDPDRFQSFLNTQSNLSSALSRLIAVAENYPNLKANENFLSLQSQLEGTENRISVERGRYNIVVQIYNTKIKQIPVNVLAKMFNFKEKVYFKAEDAAATVPKVMF